MGFNSAFKGLNKTWKPTVRQISVWNIFYSEWYETGTGFRHSLSGLH